MDLASHCTPRTLWRREIGRTEMVVSGRQKTIGTFLPTRKQQSPQTPIKWAPVTEAHEGPSAGFGALGVV